MERDAVAAKLGRAGIPTAIHYPLPINLQPALVASGSKLPVGDLAAKEVLSLPMHPYMSLADVENVSSAIANFR